MICFFQHFICNVWILCFFILFPFLLFVMFVMFECYIKEREREREGKKTEKWGRGVNCEEEIREKKEMGEGDVCEWWGRRKEKGRGVHGWWEKKKLKK
jgi:hypothetical protein